jgi:hypothetical protein
MSFSVTELDETVRAFFEGRGEAVGSQEADAAYIMLTFR